MSTATDCQADIRDHGGGWNRKSLEEHLRNGTYRADRHGPLTPDTLGLKKPPGLITASVKSQRKWIQNASDEHAVRTGHRFNERLAQYVVDFFPRFLCHSKSPWAGDPFELADWQIERLIFPLFGWVRPDGTRRFRRSYIEIPKKNGKSALASGIGIYMLVADEENGAEVWSLGADKDQAKVVHSEAINMIDASDKLSAILKINRSTTNVTYNATKSYYRAVSASPRGKHGPSIHCAIADELHEWFGDKLWNSLRYSFRARTQPLFLCITNAGDDPQSICHQQREKAEAVAAGGVVDDGFFSLILSTTRAEAEEEVAAVKAGAETIPLARKCNPGIGTIIQEQDVIQDIRDAITTPSEIPNLLRLTYGVWHTGVSPWLNSQHWDHCKEEFSDEDLAGHECSAGLDMSKTGDMTALSLIFPNPETYTDYRQLVFFWMPEKTIQERQHLVDYNGWVESGHLRVMPGPVIDYKILHEEIAELFDTYGIARFGYDAMYAKETAQWIDENFPDCEIAEIPQTMMQLAGPTAEYERLVISGKLRHNGNPVLTWQIGHTCVKADLNNNRRPVKPKHGDIRTIDGVMAGVMALRMEMTNQTEPSDYEESGSLYGMYE